MRNKRMSTRGKRIFLFLAVCLVLFAVMSFVVSAADGEEAVYQSNMYATFWSLVPPIIAIALALLTKEVYVSLFVGMICAALFYANFNFERTIESLLVGVADEDGVLQGGIVARLTDSWNMGILVFLVCLGIIVVLVNRAGGSSAYGDWAKRTIKTRRGALLSTFGLGALIFIDDYFNCLTVGSVMRPVTDTHHVSRAKLAYIIDSTAAPICIIAPISSWAAAVSGVVEGEDGLSLFLRSIPYNFYALLTIAMVITLSVLNLDFGPMRKHEQNALQGDLYTTPERPYAGVSEQVTSSHAKVIDLILPVIFLIAACVAGMVYTGGFFNFGADHVGFLDAFSACDASVGLVYGSVISLIFTIIYFLCRRVLTFKQCADAIPEGFKAMVPAILILTFAWTLSGLTGLLGAKEYVAALVKGSAAGFKLFLPALIFLIALGLAFATGTSWGTFGILLPIVVEIGGLSGDMLIMSISACLAGAVCGDHCSPISDTTIMASTGAQCHHINHVSTQLPYALFVAAFSVVGFILSGLLDTYLPLTFSYAWIMLPAMILLLVGSLVLIKKIQKSKQPK